MAWSPPGWLSTAEVASTAARRDKEAELLFAGDQFARAIARYRASRARIPASTLSLLENLLADNRFPNVRRHLRRIYRDPMTGSTEWGLVRGPNGGIIGVYSTSTAPPLKTANFPKEYAAFAGAPSYRDWVFPRRAVGLLVRPPDAGGGGRWGARRGRRRADRHSPRLRPFRARRRGTAPAPQAPAVRVPR